MFRPSALPTCTDGSWTVKVSIHPAPAVALPGTDLLTAAAARDLAKQLIASAELIESDALAVSYSRGL